MDLLYVVGDKSGWGDHEELRYSLRSACAHLLHDKLIVAGHLPAWASDSVTHVPGRDDPSNRAKGIQKKILAALKSGKVGEEFALMCDDIYLLAPWPPCWVRTCGAFYGRVQRVKSTHGPRDPWRRSMEATLRECGKLGMPLAKVRDCETHNPVPMQRDKAIATIERSLSGPVALGIGTLYAAMHAPQCVRARNAKKMHWTAGVVPTGVDVYSSSPETERNAEFRRWISSTFPKPCRWERTPM